MKNIKQVLANLSRADMHVHVIDRETPLSVRATLFDTHFVMHGARIVHVGNLKSIESFSLRL